MKYVFILLLLISLSAYAEEPKIKITKLDKNVYVHTSYKLLGDGYFPSNGLIVETDKGIVLIDTAWGQEQTIELLSWISENLKKPVLSAIITHFHEDRASGIEVLKKQNIVSYAGYRTVALLKEKGQEVPEKSLKDLEILSFGKIKIKTFFLGPGHSRDNIVVWVPKSKLLFGGCLVKSPEASEIGNIKDADLKEWPNTIRKLQSKFPEVSMVIPGHQSWGGKEAFTKTLDLLEKGK
ncbi:subclass B1 metallo-beta-lactamase [Leptospira sarikeiensis]|uniref:beta-lactamase n=1 Tax=Leptospira sarikeiensis TaxID=2484943 RepID=A0A4R9K557_9LEPT|nr:subclass B1 metallo-beta-lactamase [Leptospira sarikeiensis]TGL60668.1 subclass B1 metallo-beta-lactamase [Leptospira sarikeiensis]